MKSNPSVSLTLLSAIAVVAVALVLTTGFPAALAAAARDDRTEIHPWDNADSMPCPDADLDGVSVCMGDCDDLDASVRPGAFEQCDGKDNDCDGVVDAGWCD